MFQLRFRRIAFVSVTVVALVGSAAYRWLPGGFDGPRAVAAEPEKFSPYLDGKGNISLPADYSDIFVNNVGICEAKRWFEETADEWTHWYNVNAGSMVWRQLTPGG